VFRFYRAGWGRYTQADPLGLIGSDDLYAYVGDDPVDGIDPLGLKKIYGNWCGPDWTGGFKKPWNALTLRQRRQALPPVDALDQACQYHDLCYGACGIAYPCSPDSRSQCFRGCDVALSQRAWAFSGSGVTQWGMQLTARGNVIPDPTRQTVAVQISLHRAYRPVRQRPETAPS
jgi:hypothetical protein